MTTPFAQLLDRPVVALTGPDARRFCNAMFTNNARALPVGRSQRTAMLDDRGRVQGVMDLVCADELRFLAVLEGWTTDQFESRYGLYVVLDDVGLEPQPGLVCATVQGAAPEVPVHWFTWARDRSGLGGFDVVGPREELEPWIACLALPTVDPAVLERLRVRVGEPRWPEDFGDRRLPHEMGMRDAYLAFDKGCYLGQETVNRVDVMGEVKQRLVGLRVGGPAPFGAEILRDGAAIGRLASVVDDPELGRIGLAVVRRPADTPGTEVEIRWDGGVAAGAVVALPFASG